jgi:rod shape determining protein RodA
VNTTPLQIGKTSEQQTRSSASVRTLLGFDPLLFVAALGLVGCSLLALHGAGAVASGLPKRQAIYAGMGVVASLIVSRFDYTVLREYRWVLYGLTIVLNLAVFAVGSSSHGATRWIPLPFFQFQPSEFGKIFLILSLAAIAVDRARGLQERRTTARIMLLALVPAMVVIKQPDLGTGLVYITIACAILFFAGTSWKQLIALAALFATAIALVLAVAPAVGVNVLQPYQKQRLTTFIDPPTACKSNDPTCYQLQQGLIAIGSQAKLGYVPEAQDDFIFAVVGETYGFAGAAVVLSLYALLIWRTIRIMTMSKNLFGTLVAGGILAMFMFQIFLNVGMTIGIMPVTGVPLPLLSYGGSSVFVTFLALGLLQSIHVQARTASAGKARLLVV